MSERGQQPDDALAATQAPAAATAGALLRQARIAAGVHIESIAFSLKVPVSKIEALERDDHAALPDPVFARALAGSVCRALKTDPAPVLALLPQGVIQKLSLQDDKVRASFHDGSQRSVADSPLHLIAQPRVLAVLALLVGAGVLAWLPVSWDWVGTMAQSAFSSQQTAASSEPAPPVAAHTVIAAPSVMAAASGPVASAVAPATSAQPPAASVVSQAPAASASAAVSVAQSASAARVAFQARQDSWIQVKDVQGAVVLERILRTGESAAVTQPGRLSVVVGRADATDVWISGQKFDMAAASSRENVARFEVKP